MKLSTKLFAAFAGFALAFTPNAMAAGWGDHDTLGTDVPGNSIADHNHLWQTIQSIGVRTRINDTNMCDDGTAGAYYSTLRILLICQDNSIIPEQIVTWTANDMDTLRHEAHHIVQDCNSGRLGDARLGEIFTNPRQYNQFVRRAIGEDSARNIAQQYGSRGADQAEIFVEIEAFSVAASVPARDIADKMVEFCQV